MDNARKFELGILNLILCKKDINELSKIATNQSLNLSPTVSTLGLFYFLDLPDQYFIFSSIINENSCKNGGWDILKGSSF